MLLCVVFSTAHADIIDIHSKRKYTIDDLALLCHLTRDSLSVETYQKILSEIEIPRPVGCKWAILEEFAERCRATESDAEFLVCALDQYNRVNKHIFAKDHEESIFLFGDLLVKASKIQEKHGNYEGAAKTLDLMLNYVGLNLPLWDSLFYEISRLYQDAGLLGKSKETVEHWLEVMEGVAGNKQSEDFSFDYIRAYERLAKLNIALSDFYNANVALEKLYFHLQSTNDCWIFGWDSYISMRASVAKGMGDENGFRFYKNLYEIYERVSDELEVIDELEEKKKYKEASKLLSKLHDDTVHLSFVCSRAASEVINKKKNMDRFFR